MEFLLGIAMKVSSSPVKKNNSMIPCCRQNIGRSYAINSIFDKGAVRLGRTAFLFHQQLNYGFYGL